jgi:hypothetical protein
VFSLFILRLWFEYSIQKLCIKFKKNIQSSIICNPFLWNLSVTFAKNLQITNGFLGLKDNLGPHIFLVQKSLRKVHLPCLNEVWTTADITSTAFLLWVFNFEKSPKAEFLFKSRFFFGYGKITWFPTFS